MESPEINLSFYGQLIFDKRGRSKNGVKIASSANGVGRSGQLHAKKNETRSPTYTKYKSKFKVGKRIKHKAMTP